MSKPINRRAFLGTALVFGTLCAGNAPSAFGVTAAEKKQEVQAIKAKLDAMLEELDQAVDQYNAAQDAYRAANAKVEQAQGEIDATQKKIDSLQGHLETRATSMYRTGAMSYLDVLLGAASFDDFATVWDTLNTLNEDDADLVMETKQAKAKLEAAKRELDEQKAEAASQLETAKSYHKKIQSMTDRYESEYNSLSSEYRKLLQKEEAAERRRQQQAASAYTPSTGGSGGGGGKHSGGGSSIPTNGSVVDYARSRIGCPYVWGAEGPNSFDCSGLTMWCYAQVGISIPHYTESQYASAKARMSVYSAAPGDILYRSGHVAIYSGGGSYIHAPHTGATVCEVSGGVGGFAAALRF
ncbi:MAG: NlpC/P60 family protein [Coriobacteriales bacterium]